MNNFKRQGSEEKERTRKENGRHCSDLSNGDKTRKGGAENEEKMETKEQGEGKKGHW